MPAESCVAREKRYGQCIGPQNTSWSNAARRAGSMCGSGGSERPFGPSCCVGRSSDTGEDVVLVAGDELGDEIEAVDSSDAAIVRRMWDSVLRVSMVMQAARSNLVHALAYISALQLYRLPGQPFVLAQSSASLKKHCSHKNAPLASPAYASSRSSGF
jgi:hypothetical protein